MSSARTAAVSVSGSCWLRSTTFMPRTGICVSGKCIAMRESASSVYCLTAPTTPITVIHGVFESWPPVFTCLPMAL